MDGLKVDADAMVFRRAGVEDVDRVVALVNSAYRGDSSKAGWTTEADLLGGQRTDARDVLKLIEAEGSLILLGLIDVEVVGSVHLRAEGESVWLGMFAIRPTLQGGGLGKRFMAMAEQVAVEALGAQRMRMSVITARQELIAFYERRGYRRTGQILPFPASAKFGVSKVGELAFEVLEKGVGEGVVRE